MTDEEINRILDSAVKKAQVERTERYSAYQQADAAYQATVTLADQFQRLMHEKAKKEEKR